MPVYRRDGDEKKIGDQGCSEDVITILACASSLLTLAIEAVSFRPPDMRVSPRLRADNEGHIQRDNSSQPTL